jgi:MarR family 2-MHQ and catechol resistance regulon transcriptional repressor
MGGVARRSMAEAGLGASDFGLLEALLHLGPLSPSALAEKVRLTSGTITAALDRLESRGLIERALSTDDRRARIIDLTEHGREVIQPAYEAHARDLQRVIGRALTAPERSQLFALLRQVQHSAEEELSS